MAQVLDSIIKKIMLEGPTSISSDLETEHIDMSGVEESFAIQLDYSNGVSLNANLSVEVSVNGRDFVEISDSVQGVSDSTGTHIWDFAALGTNYIRVKIVINSGSLDIDEIVFSGKRRH